MAVLMETLANLESFVRSAETGSFSAAADAFLLVGHQVLVTTAFPIFTSHRSRVPRALASSQNKSTRWIGSDAVRELRSTEALARLNRKAAGKSAPEP
jgi:hypothetical protein